MPGPLVSEDGGTCHGGQQRRRGTFHREPSALVDDTFAVREGRVSPYAHSPALTELDKTTSAQTREAERLSVGYENSAVGGFVGQVVADLGKWVSRQRAKPCANNLGGLSQWAVVGCSGDPVDLLGWTTVYVPKGWVALDATRFDVHRATRRWLLAIHNPHQPRVVFGEKRQREFGVAKFLVSTCPVRTADLLLTSMDQTPAKWGAEGKDLTRDVVRIGRLNVERFLYRYRPIVVDGGPRYPTTLAGCWVAYAPAGPFVVQADIPDFTPADETLVDTFLGPRSPVVA